MGGFWGSSVLFPSGIRGDLGSSDRPEGFVTMVGIFLVGLGSSWPNSVPDLGGNLWGLGVLWGLGSPLTSSLRIWGDLGGFRVIPSPSDLRDDG